MKKVLVTGGAGFVGSNLCCYLVNKGDYVYCLDNLFTGRMCNINNLMSNPNFEFINWDIQNFIDLEVDEIYNAACPASPPAYQKSPSNTTKTCVLGALNVLELAKKNNAKVMQFSTSEVYGDPTVHPQIETYRGNVNPNGIRSCYDEGKRCAESLFFDYHREFGVRIKIIRIFNTYGNNMDPNDGRVVSNFICQALLNKNITIYGNGKQTRSFCYISDLVSGIVRMMESDDSFMGPVNLGNPGEFTMIELAKKVIEKTGSMSAIRFMPLPSDDPTQRRPNIDLAKKMLDWEPIVKLDEGLENSIKYFEKVVGDFNV